MRMTSGVDNPVYVLIVDTNPLDAGIVRRQLERGLRRYAVDLADSMAEALKSLSRREFDVVLLDVLLPDSCGLDTVQRIRQHRPDVPIIVLTNTDDDPLAFTALDHGAQDHLVKRSLTTELLERAILHSIQRQSHQAEVEQLLARIEATNKLLERKNRRLKKLYRTARRFVNNVSHEFRTPLTVVKEYVSLINDGLAGKVTPEQVRLLDVVADRADDLNHMVDDMLDVSRLDAGLLQAARAPSQLAVLVEQIRPGLQRKATIKQVVLDIAVPPDLPEVFCDPDHVGRVLGNFIVNGIACASNPGRVRVTAEYQPDANEVVVSVKDNGSGLGSKDAKIVFERFRHLARRRRGSTKGFGLGLSIARELIEMNFGRAWADASNEDGSTFRFSLPLAIPREVVRRYLDSNQNGSNWGTAVTLIGAVLPDEPSSGSTRDAERYLNGLLRASDLLFRTGKRRWTIVLTCAEPEVAQFLKRARKLRRAMNREHTSARFSDVSLVVRGTWDAAEMHDEVLAAFDQLMTEDMHVGPELPEELPR